MTIRPAISKAARKLLCEGCVEKFAPVVRRRKVLKYQRPREIALEEPSIGEIREACVVRAGGKCECGCGTPFSAFDPAELDHWLGGNGRRRQKQAVETCWLLRRSCHIYRTRNSPSAQAWNDLRQTFCARHGYAFQPHVVHAKLQRRA